MKVFVGLILSLLLSFISFVSASAIESVNVNENQKLVGIVDYEQMGCSVTIDGNTMVVSTSTSMCTCK